VVNSIILFGGKSRQTSLQEVQRPLMTPDECRRLPGLRKNASSDVVDAGNMLIFPAGFPAIYGTQTLYFQDEEMDRRSKIPPPGKSDNLVEIVFLCDGISICDIRSLVYCIIIQK